MTMNNNTMDNNTARTAAKTTESPRRGGQRQKIILLGRDSDSNDKQLKEFAKIDVADKDATTSKTIVGDLKKRAIEQLQPNWNSKGVTLQPENILIFRISCSEDGRLLAIKELVVPDTATTGTTSTTITTKEEEKKDDACSDDLYYLAMEFFTKLPEDLYRCISPDQLSPLVFTHPEHAQQRQWTNLTPIYCCGFKKDEITADGEPWYGVAAYTNKFNAIGVSLRSANSREIPLVDHDNMIQNFGPATPIGANEQQGHYSMSLEQYDELPTVEGHRDKVMGILNTKESHEDDREKVKNWRVSKEANKKEKKRLKEQGLSTTRSSFFRYKIGKETDLAPYGMAVVYDETSPDHVTMIQIGKGHKLGGVAFVGEGLVGGSVVTPYAYAEECEKAVDGLRQSSTTPTENFDTLLKEKILNCSDNEPTQVKILGFSRSQIVLYTAFKVASLFSLHDIKISASAEPSPPEGEFDTDQNRLIHTAAVLLHRYDQLRPDYCDHAPALKELEAANYNVKDLDLATRGTLRHALKGVWNVLDLICVSMEDEDEDEEDDDEEEEEGEDEDTTDIQYEMACDSLKEMSQALNAVLGM